MSWGNTVLLHGHEADYVMYLWCPWCWAYTRRAGNRMCDHGHEGMRR